MNRLKFFFCLITTLALYINTASAITEKWECDLVQVPEEYNEKLPNYGLLPVIFSYNHDTKIAKVSLSGSREIKSTVDVVTQENHLSWVSDRLINGIGYTISNDKYLGWSIRFIKHKSKIGFSTSDPIELSNCKRTEIAEVGELDIEPSPTPRTPLNKDTTKEKSCWAKCCGWVRCGSGDNSSND